MNAPLKLTYRVALPDSRERVFNLQMDHDTAQLTSSADPNPPAWTELPFHQCVGCPLDAAKTKHCPAALHLASIIDGFADLVSYDTVRVTVESEERSVSATAEDCGRVGCAHRK